MKLFRRIAAAGLMLAGATHFAAAADLTIAIKAAPLSADPHYYTSITAFQVNINVFDPLVKRNKASEVDPWLAESWENPDDTTWIFKLRKNVKFHDGSPFTADDVVFTYGRAGNVPNSPTSFRTYLKQIKTVTAVDAHTLRIETTAPAPFLLNDLAHVMIVSRKNGEKATTEEYNTGKATIGTGAYKFVSFDVNAQTVLAKNPDYWGEKEPWDRVTYRVIKNDSTRLAALLAGDIDVMETVPTNEFENLKKNSKVSLWPRDTSRVVLLAMDATPKALESSKVTGPNGAKLDKNPLADIRVRQAMVAAIDLDAIAKRIFQGDATPSGQMVLPNVNGYNPDVKPVAHDAAKARKLLEEAGWADKFEVNIVAANEIFPNAVKTAEAIAQLWTRIGIKATVTNAPYPVYLKDLRASRIPIALHSFQNAAGTAANIYGVMTHTRNAKTGLGSQNFFGYSNPELDKAFEQAIVTMDKAKRAKLFQQVAKLNAADATMAPLWMLADTAASRKGITMERRADRQLYATDIRGRAN